MKHWWQFDRDEDRLAYIRSVRKLTEYSDNDIDYESEAENINNVSLQGKSAYFNEEMKKLIAGGDKKGHLVKSWIKVDKCKIFPNVEKVILEKWIQNKKGIEETWNDDLQVSFDKQLFAFFRIYFPFVRLTRLLEEHQRQSGNGNLLRMVNDKLRQRFELDLKTLDENNFQNWRQGEFSAVCYHIYNAKQKIKFGIFSVDTKPPPSISYIKGKPSFEAFKRELAAHYKKNVPSHNLEKSRKELEKLTQEKKVLLKELFS